MKTVFIPFLICLTVQTSISQVSIDFTANTRVGCGVVQVSFQNKSTGPIKSYSWNLGGIMSTVENPSRIFIAPGKYNICLTITDQGGKTETLCKNEYIEVKPSFKADFTSTESLICAGSSAEFVDRTISPNGRITALIWDLGGSTGTLQLPNSVPVSSTYKDPGLYSVTLYARDEAGCESTVTKKEILRVLQKPDIKISVPEIYCSLPATVRITNLSQNSPDLSFVWSFGPGNDFNSFDPPVITYNQEGKFDFKVVATNTASSCSDTLIKQGGIVIENTAKFIANRKQTCLGEQIQFTSTSVYSGESHLWDFGDGAASNDVNPAHSYSQPGCYTVRHQTIYKGCTSIQVSDTCIRVNDLPQPTFTLDRTRGCQLPLLVQTTNTTPDGSEWTWKSNGVVLSNEKNPLLRFDLPGTYPIQLEVKNSQGCSASIDGSSVQVYKIQPLISSGEVKGCGPLFYTLEHNSTSIDPITQVRWTVFTSVPKVVIGPVAAVIIPEVGKYDVRLVIENALGCTDSVEVKEYIRVGRKPVTGMEAPKEICFGLPLQLLDKSDATANEFLWEFGDGEPNDDAQNSTKTYLNTGEFVITHRAFFNGCEGNPVSETVKILGAKAAFNILHDCNVPQFKSFINQSIGLDSLHWDFGVSSSQSDTSGQFNSQFNYPMPGGYPVTLKVFHKASNCEDTAVMTAFVSDLHAAFSVNTLEQCAPAEIRVIHTSRDVVRFQYMFDGAEVNDVNSESPVLKYAHGGNYTGRLIATDQIGCRDTFSLSDSIRIHEVMVQITSSHQNFCQDSLVKLFSSDLAVNDRISSYSWTFGNQTIPDKSEIELKIDSIQTQEIHLNVLSAGGCKANAVFTIPAGHIRVGFVSDTLMCAADSVRFLSQISGKWTGLRWDFGDGDSSDLPNPSHQYKADGVYSVRLTATDGNSRCVQSTSKDNSIRIHDPIASFKVLNSQEFCPPFIGKVSNLSQYASTYEWVYGEGYLVSTEPEPSRLFTESGTYDIRLVARTSNRCTDTAFLAAAFIVHGPVIEYTKEVFPKTCTPLPVNYLVYNNGVNLIGIEYGDGVQDIVAHPETETAFKHTYDSGGLFYSVIFATDTLGCTAFKLLDTINLHQVTPSLGLEKALICGSTGYLPLKNTSKSSDPITQLKLTVGGNNLETNYDIIPDSILLDQFGYYSLKLVMSSDFCTDSILYSDTIHLASAPAVNFEVDQPLLCEGDSVLFINRSTAISEVISFLEWKIGNQTFSGTSLNWKLPAGSLKVQLTAATENGCIDSLEQEIMIKPSVQAIITTDTLLCSGSQVHLRARIPVSIDGATFVWREGDNFLCDDCLDLTVRPDQSTVYTFEAKHPNGCLSSFDTRISTFRNPIAQLTLTADTIICLSSIIPLSADAGQELYSYQWDVSRVGLSCYQNCRNPLASPDTTTTFIVFVSNAQGCERIDSVTVTVNAPGGINLGPDRTICPGDSFQISVPGFEDYRWTGASGISCTNCYDPVLRPIKESLYIVNATEDGCPVKDSIRIHLFSGDLIPGRKDTTLCAGSAVQLRTVDQVDLKWLPSRWLNDPNTRNPVVQPDENAVFYVQAIEDLCTVLDSFRVLVLKQTEISARDRLVCPGAEFTLNAEGDATTYKWQGPNILSGQNSSSIRATTKQATTYTVIARNHTCAPDTAVIQVGVVSFLELPEVVKINVIKSLPVQLNKNIKPDSSFAYSWSPGDDLSCVDCLRPILFTDTSKTYIFQIFDPATGCELTQTFEISIIERCQAEDYFSIPNIFTPNHDGINDQLYIIPKSADLIKSFRIFDRMGDLVFETHDLGIGWDGRLKNMDMASGVYVYVIEADCPLLNQRIVLSGDVTLIR